MRNTTLPLIKNGVQYIRTHPKFKLPQNVRELQDRIRAVVQTIDGNMLKRVWQELDYRIDICRVTKDAHIEHL